ncbi:MAG: hypothetical protein DRO07_03090, partial [Candidatus Iainarchaeum archaeon]
MKFRFEKRTIHLKKGLSSLDKFVLKFVKVLDSLEIDYVIVSGYVAVLFGRSRTTEDVDIFIEELGWKRFNKFWKAINKA